MECMQPVLRLVHYQRPGRTLPPATTWAATLPLPSRQVARTGAGRAVHQVLGHGVCLVVLVLLHASIHLCLPLPPAWPTAAPCLPPAHVAVRCPTRATTWAHPFVVTLAEAYASSALGLVCLCWSLPLVCLPRPFLCASPRGMRRTDPHQHASGIPSWWPLSTAQR